MQTISEKKKNVPEATQTSTENRNKMPEPGFIS